MMIRLMGVEPSNGQTKVIIKDAPSKAFNADLAGMIRRRSLVGYRDLRVIITDESEKKPSSNIPLDWYHSPKI